MSHARLSPSAASRWMNCPGSVRENEKYPDVSGPSAIDGTHTHTLLEFCIKNGLVNADSTIGQTFTDHDGEFTVDVDRASRVTIALDYIWEQIVDKTFIESETKVNPGEMINRKDITGTADVQIVNDDMLEVIDYKDGIMPVNPVENLQMSLYAVGALVKHRKPDGTYPFSKIRLTIIQPKLAIKRLNPIQSWNTDITYINKFIGKMINAARATDHPDAELIAGDDQCKWCKHKGNCAAFIQFNMENVSMLFEDVAKQAANKEPTDLSDDEICEIVEAAPSLREMLKAVEEEALNRLKAGQTIKGLKLVHGNGSRNWSLDEKEMVDKLSRMGVPKSEIYKAKLISPAQAEKLNWTNKKGDVKSLSKRQLTTLEKEYVVKSAGKLKVVSESTDGEAVIMDASPMFNSVQPELPDWMK